MNTQLLTIGRGKNGSYPVNLDGTTVGRVEKTDKGFLFLKGLGATAQQVKVNTLKTRTMKEMRTELVRHLETEFVGTAPRKDWI